ncbi:NUP88 [Bugula neritina]|uniref:NUP88 n=1 Tax=Bugula neritina TaxID=10212 RepID=A0A7J7IVX5_BUGNE|nr:NUP88 [Bugula neritina]
MAASPLMSSCHLNNFSTLFQKAISVSSDVSHAESILVSSKNLLLVWDNFSSCFRVTLANAKPTTPLQTLLCSNPPLFPVKSVILNSVEEHVALVGDKGVAVMQMPSKYGSDQLFENGKEKILCKSLMIDERYFCSHHQEKVMKTLWHPGSPNFSILCVLTSDNTLRLYNIAKPESPFQTLSLSGDKFSAALESFVSMTFGSASSSNQHYLTWPLYLLTEMGNVFVANSSVWSPGRLTCEGPLRMFPTAEDNYGSDACDILHLASSPEALVISTVSGSLMHCVLLPGTTDEVEDGNLSAEAPLLYVYDIVKLEFLLSTASNSHLTDCQDLDFTARLQLIKDPVKVEYYHCMHSAGVHTLHLPWLFDFQTFAVQEDGATGNDLYAAEKDGKSICQHVLCTQPLSDSKPCPLRGLVVAAEGSNQTSLLCLLSNFTCIKVTTRSGPAPHLPEMVSSIVQETHGDVGMDKRMSFDRHIQTLLARDVTNPLIKTGNEQSFSAEQSYNLLARATQIFRELHINKLEMARKELDRR